jgi:hypothetical protein
MVCYTLAFGLGRGSWSCWAYETLAARLSARRPAAGMMPRRVLVFMGFLLVWRLKCTTGWPQP